MENLRETVGEAGASRARASAPRTRAFASHWVRATLVALAAAASTSSLARLLEQRVPLQILLGAGWTLLAVLLVLSLVLEACVLVRSVCGRGRAPDALADARKLVVAAVIVWGSFLVFVQPFERLWFDLGLGLAAGIFVVLVLVGEIASPLPLRWRRALDVAAFTVCLGAIGLELGLRALAVVRPSALLARATMEPMTVLERNRPKSGELQFGFPCNARGHYDVSFVRKREGARLVATIGDSFSLGVVPHACHYTTICEREIGCEVYNFGIPGAGLPEYTQMLVDEVLPVRPDLVVIGLFVGNDIVTQARTVIDPGLRAWFDRDQVMLALVPARLSKVATEERARGDGRSAATVQGAKSAVGIVGEADLELRYPWIRRPELEEETMSEATFVNDESGRAQLGCSSNLWWRYGFEKYFAGLAKAAAGTPMAVMLIPDDFQIEDDLWEKVCAANPGEVLDRDQPQKLILPFLEQQGIACLDLLPLMRAVPPLADGRRHLYHLHDTHWNARGNEVAGKAVAKFLAPLLEQVRAGAR